MLPHQRLDGSDEYEAMTTIAKSPSIAPPAKTDAKASAKRRGVQASLEVSRYSEQPIVFDDSDQSDGDDVTRLMSSSSAQAHGLELPAPPRVPSDIVPTMRPLKNRVHLPRGTEPPPSRSARGERHSARPTSPPPMTRASTLEPPAKSRPITFAPPPPPPPPSIRPPAPLSMRPQTPPSMHSGTASRAGQTSRPPGRHAGISAQESTRTIVRPGTVPPPPMSSPEDTFRPVSVGATYNASALRIQSSRNASDSSGYVAPAMVHTTSNLTLQGRPTASWAMALVAMGVFAGILTAVVTGGGGSSLAQAGASFVDPSRTVAMPASGDRIQEGNAAASAPLAVRTEEKSAPLMAIADDTHVALPVAAPAPAAPKPVDTTKPEAVAMKPQPRVRPSVAAAAQPAASAPATIAVASKPAVAATTPATTPAATSAGRSKPAVVTKPAPGAADLASAAQADELARQQLEQSL